MAKEIRVDVKENRILETDAFLLPVLLKDNSSGKNLIWATEDYAQNGEGYGKSITSRLRLSPALTGISSSRVRKRLSRSSLRVCATRPRFLLPRGYVTSKTILLITLGLVEKTFSTPKQKKDG